MVNSITPKKNRIRLTKGDLVFKIMVVILLSLLVLSIIYPLWFIIVASISSPEAVLNGEVWIIPDSIDFTGYINIFKNKAIWIGYRNTIIYTLAVTSLNLFLTIPTGYALARDELPFRKLITWFFIITMFFGGGLIPYYLVVKGLGLYNSPLTLILLGGVSVWNIFMTKAFYKSNISKELLEAAKIDGANHFQIFFKVIIPLSKPIIAVMFLFYAVGHWNSYFDALVFITNPDLQPLQIVLRDILITNSYSIGGIDSEYIYERMKLANQIKYGVIIVSSLPIIILYPFISKSFKEGFLVGSFK
jgi:putative aldouronate transport system permease protein